MTYNFDPDKWYENEVKFLGTKFKSDELSEQEFKKALEALEKRYEELWDRLSRTYQIPRAHIKT